MIREAAVSDVEVLIDLNREVHELHLTRAPAYFQDLQPAEVESWFRARLQERGVRAWIAEVDGVPVGYLMVSIHERTANPFRRGERVLEIEQIGVSPSHRRKGLSRAMIRRAAAYAVEIGICHLELNSWVFNSEAQKAFRRLGFEPRSQRFAMTIRPLTHD